MKTVFVMGSGSFGTALAVAIAGCGHKVYLWGWEADFQAQLSEERENRLFLPGVMFPDGLRVVDDTTHMPKADMVFIATPTVGVRSAAAQTRSRLKDGAFIVCSAKGFEMGSLKLMSEVIEEEHPGVPVVALSGPSHAEEVSRGQITAIVAACAQPEPADAIQDLFAGSHVRIYSSEDVRGVELGGGLKNVIALASGVADGMGLGDNAKAALMTRGITEIARLGVAMGARAETFSGLSGIGDLIVTCTSMHSRNRRCGILLGQGYSLERAMEQVGQSVEGVNATHCAHALAQRYGVEMPITRQIYRMLGGELTPAELLSELLDRPQRHESERQFLSGGL
jgi:glycerol-3-phosphate dehydrogenase (NAD(P)+)